MKKLCDLFKNIWNAIVSGFLYIWGKVRPFFNFIAFLLKHLTKFQNISINHIVYGILWLFAAISLTSHDCFGNLFETMISEKDFGLIGKPAIKEILQWFAIITLLLHQAFIYQTLHEMEHNPQKWKDDYKDWFGTKLEWILRFLALALLLCGVGKVKFIKDFIECNIINSFDTQQNLIMMASLILFLVLTIWNFKAGFKCEKWSYWKSDMLALLFWLAITIQANNFVTTFEFLKYLPILLVLIVLIYSEVIFKRLYNYLQTIPNSLS